MEAKQILTIATEVGYLLLKYGGEVYRAEQSARYICNFYGISQVDVFAIPNSIIVTIADGDDFITKTRRISSCENDLTKVEKLNALSRQIGETQLSYREVCAQLQQIDALPPYPVPIRLLGAALICLSFSMLFGATYLEGIISAVAGCCSMGTLVFLERQQQNNFIKTACCSLIISLIAFIATLLGHGLIQSDPIMTGALMILVPGLALANCMRDFMANDYVAGVTKFTEAMMTALATALGVAVVLLSTYQL